jgi:hypothetical protein
MQGNLAFPYNKRPDLPKIIFEEDVPAALHSLITWK